MPSKPSKPDSKPLEPLPEWAKSLANSPDFDPLPGHRVATPPIKEPGSSRTVRLSVERYEKALYRVAMLYEGPHLRSRAVYAFDLIQDD